MTTNPTRSSHLRHVSVLASQIGRERALKIARESIGRFFVNFSELDGDALVVVDKDLTAFVHQFCEQLEVRS